MRRSEVVARLAAAARPIVVGLDFSGGGDGFRSERAEAAVVVAVVAWLQMVQ